MTHFETKYHKPNSKIYIGITFEYDTIFFPRILVLSSVHAYTRAN